MRKFDQSKALRLVALAAVFSAAVVAEADAFTYRSVSGGTGAYGRSYSHESSGGCSGGSCSWSGSTTGPNGNTASHSGSATETGYGAVRVNGSGTGPYGGSYDRGAIYRR